MLYTLSIILLAILVAGIVVFKRKFEETWLPMILDSRAGKAIKKKFSKAVSKLFWNLVRNWWAHLETICEYEGDESYQPYNDSPLRTCPPCEFITTPPKEISAPRTVPVRNEQRRGIPIGRVRGRPIPGRHNNPVVRLRHVHLIPQDFIEPPPQSPPPVPDRIAALRNEHDQMFQELERILQAPMNNARE